MFSVLVFGTTLVAWVIAGRVTSLPQFVKLPGDCGVCLDQSGLNAGFQVFNQADDQLSFDAAYADWAPTSSPGDMRVLGIPGIYFELTHCIRPRTASLWFLTVSLAYPLLLSAILPGLWLFRRLRRSSRRGFPVQVSPTFTQPKDAVR